MAGGAVALTKVVSGGQTGVDQAALRAAEDSGFAISGWCPPASDCETGLISSRFPLKPTPEEHSSDARDVPRSLRSEWNVRDSDATLILQPSRADRVDAGTEWTAHCAARYGRPLFICDPTEPHASARILTWLSASSPRVLNVAGPSEATVAGIGDQAYVLLRAVFSALEVAG